MEVLYRHVVYSLTIKGLDVLYFFAYFSTLKDNLIKLEIRI